MHNYILNQIYYTTRTCYCLVWQIHNNDIFNAINIGFFYIKGYNDWFEHTLVVLFNKTH